MKHYTFRLFLLAMCASLVLDAGAQHLRSPGNFGFQPFPVNDSIAEAHGLAKTRGMLVAQTFPGTNFASAGVERDDILLSINGLPINDMNQLLAAKQDFWDGDPFKLEVWRAGKVRELKGKVAGKEPETSDRWDVVYDEVPWDGGYLSAIVTKPRSPGRHPAVYFIPGYTCSSVDNLPALHPYRKIVDSLSALGYVVVRVEKPGMGRGPAPCQCNEIGFDKELEAFRAGWRHLLKYDFVDPGKAFIFGHSMGGVEAPFLAAQEPVPPLGVAVYGTVYQTWYEYILAMLRFQEPRNGEDFISFEQDMAEYTKLFYEHYVLHKPLETLIQNPKWKALLERDFFMDDQLNLLSRHYSFFFELSKHDLVTPWAKANSHVLSIYGEADFEVFNPASMSEIARIVNFYHPGKGSFVSLPGTDHSFIEVGSMDEGLALRGTPQYRDYLVNHFNWQVVTAFHNWMQEVMREN